MSEAVIKLEDRQWQDIKDALDRIGRRENDILADWVVIGERLRAVRAANPGYRNSGFAAEVKAQGIKLNGEEISAAQWWAGLADQERSQLREKYPRTTTPRTFYVHRKEHTEEADTLHTVQSKSARS